MMIGFVTVSIVAAVFLGIGISCRKSKEAVGFFTFVKTPGIEDVKHYNNLVSILWFISAGIFEMIGISMLFLEQNSPFFVLIIFAVLIWLFAMMVAYFKIEAKYRK